MDSIPQSSVWILKALSRDADEGLFTPDCTVETLDSCKIPLQCNLIPHGAAAAAHFQAALAGPAIHQLFIYSK